MAGGDLCQRPKDELQDVVANDYKRLGYMLNTSFPVIRVTQKMHPFDSFCRDCAPDYLSW